MKRTFICRRCSAIGTLTRISFGVPRFNFSSFPSERRLWCKQANQKNEVEVGLVGWVGCVSVRGGGGRSPKGSRNSGYGARKEGRKYVAPLFIRVRSDFVGRRVGRGRNYGRAAELRRLELRRAHCLLDDEPSHGAELRRSPLLIGCDEDDEADWFYKDDRFSRSRFLCCQDHIHPSQCSWLKMKCMKRLDYFNN